MFVNQTKNQHFISVAEQRLNASNLGVSDRHKAKIFSFEVIDRENFKIELSAESEVKAVNNLSFLDLYTFELISTEDRVNLEKLFQRIEQHASISTNEILDKNSFTLEHFMNVFKLKLLNIFRNPYCIDYALQCFDQLNDVIPVDIELKNNFAKIDSYKYPLEIMARFNVTESNYKKWLKIIFLLTVPIKTDHYLLDKIAENFFNTDKIYHSINLCTYSSQTCLLSDRSYINVSSLSEFSDSLILGFNLRKDALMYVTFLRNDIVEISKNNLDNCCENIANKLQDAGIKNIQKSVFVNKVIDNLDILKSYNRQVIYQCHKNVYSATKNILI